MGRPAALSGLHRLAHACCCLQDATARLEAKDVELQDAYARLMHASAERSSLQRQHVASQVGVRCSWRAVWPLLWPDGGLAAGGAGQRALRAAGLDAGTPAGPRLLAACPTVSSWCSQQNWVMVRCQAMCRVSMSCAQHWTP